jgi:hypothetical protein
MVGSYSDQRIRRLRLLIVAAGLILLAVGLLRGEAIAILRRAILICLGCIGIG